MGTRVVVNRDCFVLFGFFFMKNVFCNLFIFYFLSKLIKIIELLYEANHVFMSKQ